MKASTLIAEILSVLLLILVGCDPSIETVKNTADQTKLAQIAVKAKDSYVRHAAVWKLTDQTVLAKIAREDTDADVRRAAAEKLTDQTLLAKIAREDEVTNVRRVAAEKLTDQALLANKMGMWVKPELTRQVTDQAVLAQLAVEARDSEVRLAAVRNLTDQVTLAELTVGAKWMDIRIAAIGKLTNQEFLHQLAEEEPQAAVRQAAVRQIADERFLIQRLDMEPSAAVRAAIVATLHKETSLRTIAQTAYHRSDRQQALRRLKKVFQDPASDVLAAHKVLTLRVKALAAETDSSRLLTLALEGEFDDLRIAAVRRLKDPVALEEAAMRASDREVLKILLAKLEDKAMLNRITTAANDRAMRLAAMQKAGAKSWGEIFDGATAKYALAQMLGDAIAAVSLFPEVQPDAVNGVQHASLNLIRRGDESRIPEMVDLLESYGDKRLAEDYLNCGQPDLNAAGRAWAHRRGYPVSTGAGSSRATWGSGR